MRNTGLDPEALLLAGKGSPHEGYCVQESMKAKLSRKVV